MGKSTSFDKVIVFAVMLALAFGALLALPTIGAAAASIDVSSLGMAGNETNPAGDDTWAYNDANKTLWLYDANGIYTLYGTNTILSVQVWNTAAFANVTFNNLSVRDATVGAESTITLVGTSSVNGESGITVNNGVYCTVGGAGTLTTTATQAGLCGIYLNANATLSLTGSAIVDAAGVAGGLRCNDGTAVIIGPTAQLNAGNSEYVGILFYDNVVVNCDGALAATGYANFAGIVGSSATAQITFTGSGTITATGGSNGHAISTDQPIKMGDSVMLVMNNNRAFNETHTFEVLNAASTLQWVLQGSATSTDPGTDPSIVVSVPAGTSGVVKRGTPTAPTITSADSYSCITTVGGTFTFTATGTPPITWTVTGLPAGVTVSGNVLTVDPSVPMGDYNLSVKAANGTAPDATQAFTLIVTKKIDPLAITSANKYTCVAGTGGTFAFAATGGEPPIVFSLVGQPAGVTVSGGKLVVAKTVSAGSYSFTVVATDGHQLVEQAFTLTVTKGADGGTDSGTSGKTPKAGDSLSFVPVLTALLGCTLALGTYRIRRRD
jgi:hypothetical protein